MAAAGNPNIAEELKKGKQIGDRTYKCHLDGYNQMDMITGKGPSNRHEIWYFGESELGAGRIDDYKFRFIDQPGGWLGDKTKADVPYITDLRLDPFERVRGGRITGPKTAPSNTSTGLNTNSGASCLSRKRWRGRRAWAAGEEMLMSIFDLVAMLLTVSAAFAFLNAKLLRLPTEIGVLVMGLAASQLLIGLELVTAQTELTRELTEAVRQIDFQASLMNGMLAFLLFAGALHVDWAKLKSRAASVALLATVGVLISTAIVGAAFWLAATWFGTPIPLLWALVFGALISPTDPVAVLTTLKSVNVPEDLKVEMSGEALLNDGVGVVVFTILLAAAVGQEAGAFDPVQIGRLFFVEALGGAVFGLIIGYTTYRAMRVIDDYPIEVLISLAAVMATYSLAGKLHLSGPIAVVCAGLLIGERGPSDAMSETTQRYMFSFWSLADAILNIVLFLLIGIEVLVLRPDRGLTTVALLAVPIVLVARWISVALPVSALRLRMRFLKGTIPVLTWGGVRGGISIALVLSMPDFPQTSMILAATYAIVIFSIVVQGLTLGWLVRKVVRTDGL